MFHQSVHEIVTCCLVELRLLVQWKSEEPYKGFPVRFSILEQQSQPGLPVQWGRVRQLISFKAQKMVASNFDYPASHVEQTQVGAGAGQELQQRTNLIRAVHLLSDPIDQMVFEVVCFDFTDNPSSDEIS